MMYHRFTQAYPCSPSSMDEGVTRLLDVVDRGVDCREVANVSNWSEDLLPFGGAADLCTGRGKVFTSFPISPFGFSPPGVAVDLCILKCDISIPPLAA
jgi:hypothetical protein